MNLKFICNSIKKTGDQLKNINAQALQWNFNFRNKKENISKRIQLHSPQSCPNITQQLPAQMTRQILKNILS